MSTQTQYAAARAAIRDTILQQTMPVELLIDALLGPAYPSLRAEAAWAFDEVGRGILVINYLPLLRDQDQVTTFVPAPALGQFAQLGDAVHQAVVASVAAYDPATQYVMVIILPKYPPQVRTWPQASTFDDRASAEHSCG